MKDLDQRIFPFLMFSGKAEEAMNFYISIFDDAKISQITRYGPNEAGAEGTVLHAIFSLKGQEFMCIDSAVKHEFSFTPAFSFYVNCDSEEEVDRSFKQLSEGGAILMPLDSYPFSNRFGWVQDQYGVSWQLSLK